MTYEEMDAELGKDFSGVPFAAHMQAKIERSKRLAEMLALTEKRTPQPPKDE